MRNVYLTTSGLIVFHQIQRLHASLVIVIQSVRTVYVIQLVVSVFVVKVSLVHRVLSVHLDIKVKIVQSVCVMLEEQCQVVNVRHTVNVR